MTFSGRWIVRTTEKWRLSCEETNVEYARFSALTSDDDEPLFRKDDMEIDNSSDYIIANDDDIIFPYPPLKFRNADIVWITNFLISKFLGIVLLFACIQHLTSTKRHIYLSPLIFIISPNNMNAVKSFSDSKSLLPFSNEAKSKNDRFGFLVNIPVIMIRRNSIITTTQFLFGRKLFVRVKLKEVTAFPVIQLYVDPF